MTFDLDVSFVMPVPRYRIYLIFKENTGALQGGYFVPASLFQRLPDHSQLPQKSPVERKKALQGSHSEDYRQGPIIIDWMDFEQMASTSNAVVRERAIGKGELLGTIAEHEMLTLVV